MRLRNKHTLHVTVAGNQEQNPSNSISSNELDAGVGGVFDGSGPKRELLGLLGSKTKIQGNLNMFSAQKTPPPLPQPPVPECMVARRKADS